MAPGDRPVPGLEVVAIATRMTMKRIMIAMTRMQFFVCSGEERHPGSSQDIGGGERKGGGGSWS